MITLPAPSPTIAFWALVGLTLRRHWRVRQMGWIAVGLLGLTAFWVLAVTISPAGWGLENRRIRRLPITYREYSEELRPSARYEALEAEPESILDRNGPPRRPTSVVETPTPLDPLRDSLTSLILSIPHALMNSRQFLDDWAFMNFSRAVVLGAYLGFTLPLFTLAYASGAIGAERESRSLIWLMTRPMPRWGIYLAKWLGTVPWCICFGVGGLAALCLAGGKLGREAFALYWPAAVVGTFAFTAIFHLIGALFRRPVVVGLVYIFFFESLVAALPGSLKLLSVTFYIRSAMYQSARDAGFNVDMLDVPATVSSTTSWCILIAATFTCTIVGARIFTRAEYRDDL